MTTNAATRPVWADATIRLDPYALPQRVSLPGDRGRVTLDAGGATVKTALKSGLPLSMALPNRAFTGVAARAFDNEDGTTTVTLELLHADPDLCVPLCVSHSVEDAACDWKNWAKRLGLPMLMIGTDGSVAPVADPVGLASREPKPRRRRTSFLPQRPNFLRRRKPGMVGPVVRITADEIIARN